MFKYSLDNKRYHTLNYYLKNKFNELLQKVKEIDVQEVKCDFEKKIKKPRSPRLALEPAAPLYYLITTYQVMIALFQTIFPFFSSFIYRILFIMKYKISENAMIAIYVPIPKDTRNTTKIPKSATSKDVPIDTKLILLRASLDTYPLI